MRTRLSLAASVLVLALGWAGHSAWGGSTGTWTIVTVDSAGDVGKSTALALDSAGNPQIAYADYTSANHMKFALFNGTAWSNETISTVDWFGGNNSMKLDTNGYPVISYFDNARGYPTVVRWNGAVWSARDVIEAGYGNSTSLALDTNGNLRVSFVDYVNGFVKYAQKNGGTWTSETVAAGTYSSLALDTNGYPLVSYRNGSPTYNLTLAQWTGTAWAVATVDNGIYTGGPSMALDHNGNPFIAYRDGTYAYLKFAKWNGAGWDVSIVDTLNSGASVSLAIDHKNNPHIAYDTLEVDGKIRYAKWTGSAWEKTTIASNGDTSGGLYGYVSLALNQNDEARISYYDIPNKDLKFASYTRPLPNGTVVLVR